MLNLYVMGELVNVIIDDRIPTKYKKPIHAQLPKSKGWWMIILEKAYAKLNINFSNLDGGYGEESLRALTGMPIEFHKTSRLSE